MDVQGCDYDQSQFHLFSAEGRKNNSTICLSLAAPYLQTIVNTMPAFKEQLAQWGLKVVPCEADYHLTVQQENLDIALLSSLLFRSIAWPIEQAMRSQQAGEPMAPFFLPLRQPADGLWVQADTDRVTIILATSFVDPDDALLGKVFLQELFDQRKDLAHQDAPAIILGKTAPAEFKVKLSGQNIWYLTMVLFPRHYANNPQPAIHAIVTLRDYLHYHIKCCKVQLHVRMRQKSDLLVKHLNRAKREFL